jgi:hypothetical protein
MKTILILMSLAVLLSACAPGGRQVLKAHRVQVRKARPEPLEQ